MSATAPNKDPSNYTEGEDRYVRFAEDFLGMKVSEQQKKILRAVATNSHVLVVGANGFGKSYIIAALCDSFIATNPDSVGLGTSGSYSQFVDTMWNPMKSMAKQLRDEHGLPVSVYDGNQPKLEFDDQWFFKVVSPRDPGDLEGRHASDVLVVIEEADKQYITEEHFDSAGSSVTDMNDRMIAVANPPEDESNIVYELMQNDSRWETLQFSSFDAHNVQLDLGNIDDERIPGIVDLITIADDWEAWNDEPWPKAEEQWPDDDYPGVSELKDRVQDGILQREELVSILEPGATKAEFAHKERDDLDKRWYRRRAGVQPPDSATVFRPFTVQDVEEAYEREADVSTITPQGIGLDVARKGGDNNVLCAKHSDVVRVHDRWKGVDHNTNEKKVKAQISGWAGVDMAIDAQGEGSGLADRVSTFHDEVIRFNAGQEAAENTEYYDRWTEGLYKLGQFLRDGGTFKSRRLREELLAAAREVEIEEKYYSSREDTVFKASPKDDVKEHLGRSPDLLDSAYMAVWAASGAAEHDKERQRLTW